MTRSRRNCEHDPDLADYFALPPRRRLALARSHRPLERPLETLVPFTPPQPLFFPEQQSSAGRLPEPPAQQGRLSAGHASATASASKSRLWAKPRAQGKAPRRAASHGPARKGRTRWLGRKVAPEPQIWSNRS